MKALGWGLGWGGAVFHGKSLEAGIPSVICTFSKRASSVVMPGKAHLSGDYAMELGLSPSGPTA